MDDFNCPQCRTRRDVVIVTKDFDKQFDDLSNKALVANEKKLGLKFDDRSVRNDVMSLLRFNCPIKDCDYYSTEGWKDLKAHVKEAHNLHFCYLCISGKKAIFTKEFALYTSAGLRHHESQTEPDEDGFKGHPSCPYCSERFYSEDDRLEHLNKKHFRCDVCLRENALAPRFFADIDRLTEHYSTEHFPCKVPACLEKKHIVFASKIELQNHMSIEHPDIYTNKRLDIDFTFNNSNRNSNNRYRSQLSTVQTPNSRNNDTPVQLSRGDAFPALGAHASGSSTPITPTNWTVTPEMAEQADRRLQERVRIMLKDDPIKFAQFDQINEQFLKGEKTAYDLIAQYKELFPESSIQELEATVHGFTKVIIHNPVKVRDLNRAWEEYRLRLHLPAALASASSSSSMSGGHAPMARGSKSGVAPWSTGPVSRKAAKAAAILSHGDTSSFPSLPPVSRKKPIPLTRAPAAPALTVRKPAVKSYSTASSSTIVGKVSSSSSLANKNKGKTLGSASWASSNSSSSSLNTSSTTAFPTLGGGSASSSSTSINRMTSSHGSSSSGKRPVLNTSEFPSLPGSRPRPVFEPTHTGPTRELNSNTIGDVLQATTVLRPSRGAEDDEGSSSSGATSNDRKGKKKKEKKILFSYSSGI